MSSVNSVRIPGLATGMDTDQMIKDMLTGEQSKVDGAKQKEQITKWQQESYRGIIKDVKGLYDKYFSATSKDFILSSKVFSTTVVESSKSNIISASAGAGASNVNYKFKVEQLAKPASLESDIIKDADGNEIKLDKNKTLGELKILKIAEVNPIEVKTTIKLNNKDIEISSNDKIGDVVKKINDKFPGGEVKASYSEMTGKVTIEAGKTGESSKLDFSGELFGKLGISPLTVKSVESKEIEKNVALNLTDKITINGTSIDTLDANSTVEDLVKKINESVKDVTATYDEATKKLKLESKIGTELKLTGLDSIIDSANVRNQVSGSNNKINVYASDANDVALPLNTINGESNTFTIDNITYSANGVSSEFVSITSTKDTKQTVEKVQAFIDDYNKILEDIYDNVTEKKNKDYPPLTEAQKEDMSEEEIEKWEKKAKEGLLRNDKELRAFMDDIKKAIFAPIGELNLSDIGIQSDEDYNKQGQLKLNVDKFTKALEDNGDLVYKTTTGAFEKIKDVTYKYAGSSSSIFVKKAGMDKTSTAINNLFSEQLRRQEEQIKNLTRKMQDKESSLYKKFATLETNMNRLNSQMSYLTSSMGM